MEKNRNEKAFNVAIAEAAGVVTITIDTNTDGRTSSTGKSQLLASTAGSMVHELKSGKNAGKALSLGVNAFLPKRKVVSYE